MLSPHPALPFPRNIATIAVFYALPVVQLVITYQTVSGQGPAPRPVLSALSELQARLCHRLGPRPQCRASSLALEGAQGPWVPIPTLPYQLGGLEQVMQPP